MKPFADVKYRSVELKRKIDFAVNNDDINSLAVSNCEYCNYRIVCQSYKNNLMNKKIGSRIDLHGKVVKVNIAEIQIEIVNRIFIVKKIATDKKIKIGSEISIYNLYYPDEEKNILYFLDNTIIKHE